MRDLDRGIVDLSEIRQFPKRFQLLNDNDRAAEITEAILGRVLSSEAGRDGDAQIANVASALVDAAIKVNSRAVFITLLGCTVEALSDPTISVSRFTWLANQSQKLCRWLLVHRLLDDLLNVVSAFHRFKLGEVACSEKHRSVAVNFINRFGTTETVSRLVRLLKAHPKEYKTVMNDLLNMLPTQSSARILCQIMACPDNVVRLLALRVLSNYDDITIKALGSVLDELEPKLRSRSNPLLKRNLWYRLRNVVFVAGNIVSADSVKIIERLVDDPDARLAGEIIEALEKIGGERSGTLLCKYLHFPDEAVRRRAAISVGNLCDKKALPHLIEAYRNDPGLRVLLAPILANVGGEDVVEFLTEAASQRGSFFKQVLDKSGDDEKIAAISALSQIVTRKSLRHLKRLRRNYGVKFNGIFGSKSVQIAINNAVQRLEKQLRTGQNGWQIRY
jgi:hypothetical protein